MATLASLGDGVLHHPRRHELQKLFSAFPDSWPGLGLFILRVAVALSGIVQAYCAVTAPSGAGLGTKAIALSSLIVGFGLLVGLLTPLMGVLATCGYLINGITLLIANGPHKHTAVFAAFDLAVMSLTLVLLGPGAFSFDARLFARREIIIPDGRHSAK